MSELINNSKERQDKLKKLIKKIHDGMPIDEAKKLFKADFEEISTDEIVAMEQSLIDEGMKVSLIFINQKISPESPDIQQKFFLMKTNKSKN
jgi:hypothetical protein